MVTSTTSGITASRNAVMPGAQFQHRDDDEAQHQQVAQDHQQAGREQLVEGVHVGGDTGDQAAHRVVIVEGKIQALQPRHHFAPQVEHGFLSHPLHDVLLAEVAKHAEDDDQQVEKGDLRETGPGAGGQIRIEDGMGGFSGRRQVTIHCQSGEQRAERLQHGVEQQQDQRGNNGEFVRPNVGEQASHQTPIVGFS